jgi:carboxyl-terminal processing protease
MQMNRKEENKKFDEMKSSIESLTIIPIQEDKMKMSTDTIFSAKREKWFKDLKKDHYLNEAVNVVADINSL